MLSLFLDVRLNLAEVDQVILVRLLDDGHPMQGDKRLKPVEHALVLAQILRLELYHDLLEQSADQLVILDAH